MILGLVFGYADVEFAAHLAEIFTLLSFIFDVFSTSGFEPEVRFSFC